MQTVELSYQAFGNASNPALIILHGLLGSARNWKRIATQLAEQYHVYTLDLRNHGASPHATDMTYPLMAADVLAFMQAQQLSTASVLGHSMGGKVAMWMALTEPQAVQGLVVVDIAPVPYANHYGAVFQGLQSIPLAQITSRQQADTYLAEYIDEQSMRQFLLQNLRNQDGQYAWRIGLDAIEHALSAIIAFPEVDRFQAYTQPVLFIAGGQSAYLIPEHYPLVESLFPNCQLEIISNAGHWVHAEQPQKLLQLLREFSQ